MVNKNPDAISQKKASFKKKSLKIKNKVLHFFRKRRQEIFNNAGSFSLSKIKRISEGRRYRYQGFLTYKIL